MKKLILLAVSAALLLSCFAVSGSGEVVHAGAGFGFGESIKEPEDLIPLLEFIIGGEDSEGSLSEDDFPYGVVTMSAMSDQEIVRNLFVYSEDGEFIDDYEAEETVEDKDDEKNNDDEDEKNNDDDDDDGKGSHKKETEKESDDKNKKKKSKYTSATMNIETNVSAQTQYGTASGSRSMTVYITETATFYRTKGEVTSSSSYNGYRSAADAVFDMEIVQSGEKSYFCFREFSSSYSSSSSKGYSNGSLQIRGEYRGVWIEMPQSVLGSVASIDSENREGLEMMGEIIEMLTVTGEIDEYNKVIEINEDEYVRLYNKVNESNMSVPKGTDITYKIDLSSAMTPSIFLSLTQVDEDNAANKAIATEIITFSNINNTVVNFKDSDVEAVIDEEDEPEKYFLIEEEEHEYD